MGGMRREISNQVYEFAEHAYSSGGPVRCAVTGNIVGRDEAHVDHSSPTFLELAEQFTVQQGGWDRIAIVHADRSIGVQLSNADQAKAWRDYHRHSAKLRIVSIEANLSILRRGRRAD
jgi:hypothetical protein